MYIDVYVCVLFLLREKKIIRGVNQDLDYMSMYER